MPFDPNKPFEVIKPTEGESDSTVVQDPKLGDVRYTADWTPNDIQKDMAQKRVEVAKIEAAQPQLTLREKFEQAPTSADKMKVLTEFAYAQGVRGAAPAAGYYFGGRPGMIAGGIAGEAAARTIEGQPITKGVLAKAAIEATPLLRQAQMLGNALKLAGVNVAGEAVQEAIDRKDMISLEGAAKAAERGGIQALVGAGISKVLGGGKAAAKEAQRKIDDAEIIKGLQQANEEKLVLDPVKFTADKGQDVVKRKIMGVSGGQDEFQKAASLVNEPKVMEITRREIGASPDMPLNTQFFVQRQFQLAEPYRQIKSLSATAKDAVENWMEANADASNAYRTIRETANASARQDARIAAREAKKEADTAFQVIKDEANKSGNPKLVERLEKARIDLAKLHAVDAATNRGTAKPDARILGMMFEDGAHFTGGLETLGRIGSIMPEVVTPAAEFMGKAIKKSASQNGGVAGSLVGGALGFLGSSRAGVDPSVGGALGTVAGYGLNKASAAVPPLVQQAQMNPAYQAAAFLPRYLDQYPGFKSEFMRFATPGL
jgi:hypothetical protein